MKYKRKRFRVSALSGRSGQSDGGEEEKSGRKRGNHAGEIAKTPLDEGTVIL